MHSTQPRVTVIPRGTIIKRLAVGIVSVMAFAPGCGDSPAVHVVDPTAAAKTLVGDTPAPRPSKVVANKRLRKLIEDERQDIAKHPKIH